MYLNSIKSFFPNDDLFNFNYGQTLVQLEQFEEALTVLEGIDNPDFTNELAYQLALCKAFLVDIGTGLSLRTFLPSNTTKILAVL